MPALSCLCVRIRRGRRQTRLCRARARRRRAWLRTFLEGKADRRGRAGGRRREEPSSDRPRLMIRLVRRNLHFSDSAQNISCESLLPCYIGPRGKSRRSSTTCSCTTGRNVIPDPAKVTLARHRVISYRLGRIADAYWGRGSAFSCGYKISCGVVNSNSKMGPHLPSYKECTATTASSGGISSSNHPSSPEVVLVPSLYSQCAVSPVTCCSIETRIPVPENEDDWMPPSPPLPRLSKVVDSESRSADEQSKWRWLRRAIFVAVVLLMLFLLFGPLWDYLPYNRRVERVICKVNRRSRLCHE